MNEWYDIPSEEMTLEQARSAVRELRKKVVEQFANMQNEWISVEDKTADIGKPILLYSEPTGYILGQFVREEEFVADDGCPMSIACLLGIYAYWTYLPEPPKENKP